MSTVTSCPSCNHSVPEANARFCIRCGAKIEFHPQVEQFNSGFEQGERGYSRSLINTVRLLSAISMFSAMFAVIRFGSNTADGRLLIVLSVMTSFSGQLFVIQATKDNPKPWAKVPLILLCIGLASVGIAWIVQLT
jgi:hypothetical protein